MWQHVKALKNKGILSINRRNSDYVLKYNARRHFPLVDNKLKTKELAQAAGLNVPELYQIIHSEHQIREIDTLLSGLNDFVVKPAHGAGGDGILVIAARVGDAYRHVNGRIIHHDELSYHLSCLLAGSYSLGGHPDFAIIERRVIVDPVFDNVSYKGVPDIRIITLLGYPAMAMVRLPTCASGGRANLHQGAIGVGIDMHTGTTQGGVIHNLTTSAHPDTLNPIAGIQIPHWEKALSIAARCFELTKLGYLGVDLVLDKEKGPLILELNARPGLNIQIANRVGLNPIYHAIERHAAANPNAPCHERIAVTQQIWQDNNAYLKANR